MNIFSNEAKNKVSSNSPFSISSSFCSSDNVLSVECFKTSLTVRKCGLSSLMTQQLGETLISQSVKAYRASMVLSDETPGARCTRISTFFAVLSSTFLILILPLSFAFRIDSMIDDVVLPYGISEMTRVLLSCLLILARIFTEPPRSPSLYLLTSMYPPVWKSGYKANFSPFRYEMDASISSLKLCGRILEERPTAIPSTPCASNSGNLTGSVTGSRLRPS